MSEQAYQITRDLIPAKYHWLSRPILAGTVVYRFSGCTYGCVSSCGQAITLVDGEGPFIEVPLDSIRPIPSTPDREQ